MYVLTESNVLAADQVRAVVSFPVPAPEPLLDSTTNVGVAATLGGPTQPEIEAAVSAENADATCSGNAGAPTAPPGKLCFYVGGNDMTNIAADSVSAFGGTGTGTSDFERSSGGVLRASAAAAGDIEIRGTWAYTAP
jgi:hypothetical protein